MPFLPHGTEVRMRHKGEYHHPAIEGDGQLANLTPSRKGGRDSWIHMWIRRPAIPNGGAPTSRLTSRPVVYE